METEDDDDAEYVLSQCLLVERHCATGTHCCLHYVTAVFFNRGSAQPKGVSKVPRNRIEKWELNDVFGH